MKNLLIVLIPFEDATAAVFFVGSIPKQGMLRLLKFWRR